MDDENPADIQEFGGGREELSCGRSTMLFRKKFTDTEEGPVGSIDDNNSVNKF